MTILSKGKIDRKYLILNHLISQNSNLFKDLRCLKILAGLRTTRKKIRGKPRIKYGENPGWKFDK